MTRLASDLVTCETTLICFDRKCSRRAMLRFFINALNQRVQNPVTATHASIVARIESSFPCVWNLLNRKARERLPNGLKEYLADENAEEGWNCLRQTEENLIELTEYISQENIGNAFRRDMSGVGDVNKVSELFCELATALSFAMSSSKPIELRPKNKNGKACDFSVTIRGSSLSVEVKRYGDKNEFERYPSVVRDEIAAEVNDKPRSMEIRSKLKTVPKQLPNIGLSMITVFHSSIGDSAKYIQKALFGDQTCSLDPAELIGDNCTLYDDGLFSASDFKIVTCVASCCINDVGIAKVTRLWHNPNANVHMDKDTRVLLLRVGH